MVLLAEEARPEGSVKVGADYCDLIVMTEKEVLGPGDPEVAVALSSLVPVKDNSLILSTSTASHAAMLTENAQESARQRLASSVKALGRADDALSEKASRDADFWLLSASYDMAYAWLYSVEEVPAPSHLLAQLKRNSRGSPRRYETFSKAAGLERASRARCEARLEAVSVLCHNRQKWAVGWTPASISLVDA